MVNKPTYLLDSYAILAYLNGEAGGERVREILELARDQQCGLVMSSINLGEVLYIIERGRGLPAAQLVQALIENLPIDLIEVSHDLILVAAHIKASHPLSCADALATATAEQVGATILTGDPEFKSVRDLVKVEWLVESL